MKILENFELDIVLSHLARLQPENVASLPLIELEWILADFVVSGGQRLLLEPQTWLQPAEVEKLRPFAQFWWPLFIGSDFPRVDLEQLRTLALATTCLILHTLYLDEIIDNEADAHPKVKMAIPFVLEQWFHLSARLFPADSRFWLETRRAMIAMSRSMLAECRHQLRALTLDEYIEMGRGRMAFAHVSSIGLACLNGSSEQLPFLYDFWNAFSLSTVLHDDIVDWVDDYEHQTYSYLHTQILFSDTFRAEVERGSLPNVEEIGTALFYSNIVESLYDVALSEMLRAQSIALNHGYLRLAELSEHAHARLLRQQDALVERKLGLLFKTLSQKGDLK